MLPTSQHYLLYLCTLCWHLCWQLASHCSLVKLNNVPSKWSTCNVLSLVPSVYLRVRVHLKYAKMVLLWTELLHYNSPWSLHPHIVCQYIFKVFILKSTGHPQSLVIAQKHDVHWILLHFTYRSPIMKNCLPWRSIQKVCWH